MIYMPYMSGIFLVLIQLCFIYEHHLCLLVSFCIIQTILRIYDYYELDRQPADLTINKYNVLIPPFLLSM